MAKDMLIQHQLKRLRLPTIGSQYTKLAQEAARITGPTRISCWACWRRMYPSGKTTPVGV